MADKMNETFDEKEDSGLPPADYTSQQPPQYQVMDREATAGVHYPQTMQPQTIVVQPQASTLPPGVGVVVQPQVTNVPQGIGLVNMVQVAQSNQVMNVNPGTKDWSAGLCGCFDDIGGCLCVLCCPFFAMTGIANRLGENPCIICYVPGSVITLRTKLRLLAGIKGSVCNDCCTMYWCPYCALCQMKREMDNVGIPNTGCC